MVPLYTVAGAVPARTFARLGWGLVASSTEKNAVQLDLLSCTTRVKLVSSTEVTFGVLAVKLGGTTSAVVTYTEAVVQAEPGQTALWQNVRLSIHVVPRH